MDPLRRDVRIGAADRLQDAVSGRAVGDVERVELGPVDDLARQHQGADVTLVGAGHLDRLVEEVEHRHRSRRLALGETRGAFEGVDGPAPDGDAAAFDVGPELVPAVGALVEQQVDQVVEALGDLRPGVNAAEAEQRVGAHLSRLASFGHQTLTEAYHHGVVLGETAGGVPQRLAQHIGGDRVGTRHVLHVDAAECPDATVIGDLCEWESLPDQSLLDRADPDYQVLIGVAARRGDE